jgi:predicted nuclease of predicted toxin-antitoxin system
MDVHLPLAITEGLRRRGIDVVASQDDGTAFASDVELLERASRLGRLFVTQDRDFLGIAADWAKSGRAFAGICRRTNLAPVSGKSLKTLN